MPTSRRRTEIESMRSKIASMNLGSILDNAVEVKGVKIVTAMLSGTGSDALRTMCDKIRDEKSDTADCSRDARRRSGRKGNACSNRNGSGTGKGRQSGVLGEAVAQLTGGNGGVSGTSLWRVSRDQTKIDEALAAVEKDSQRTDLSSLYTFYINKIYKRKEKGKWTAFSARLPTAGSSTRSTNDKMLAFRDSSTRRRRCTF